METTFKGFVLKTVDYKDSDIILTILKEKEIVSVLARGAKKINSKRKSLTLLYSFNEFEVQLTKGNHMSLKGGRLLYFPSKALSSLQYILIFSFLSDYIVNLNEIEFGYYLFSKSFDLIEKEKDSKLILLSLLNEITTQEGLKLNVDNCSNCGSRKGIVYFSYNGGGFLCKNCSEKSTSKESLEQIRILLKIKLNNCDRISHLSNNVNDVIIKLIEILEDKAGISFKAKKLLLETINKED